MKFTNICPACNTINNEFIAASLSKWMLFHLYGWRVDVQGCSLSLNAPTYRCHECDFIYFSGRYDPKEMEKIYSDYQGKRIDNREIFEPDIRKMGANSTYSGIRQENRKKYFKDFISNINFEYINRPKLLDFGGNGSMVPEDVFDVYSYDVGNESTPQFVSRINNLEDLFIKQPFNIVTCNHVLEHVPEPQHLLAEIRGICQKETYFYLEVPYEMPSVPLNQPSSLEKCLGLDGCDEHINKFNVKSLLSILTNTGFLPIKIDAQTLDWGGGWIINVLRVLSRKN